MAQAFIREVKVGRHATKAAGKEYEYGVIRIVMPREYIGKTVKVIILVQ